MRIADVCTTSVYACEAGTDLVTVARTMKDKGIGAMPVVDRDRRVIAMITDRDICLATAARDLRPSEMRVGEAMSGEIHACRPQDELEVALRVMRAYHVRRLPVADDQDVVRGLLSIDDIARVADETLQPLLLQTFAEICRWERREPLPAPLNTPTTTEAA